MVKGITKQAVLVRSPDPELFEQAIFIVRGERGDVTPKDILRQAREAAGRYVSGKTVGGRRSGRLAVRLGWLLLGAALVGAVWLLTALL